MVKWRFALKLILLFCLGLASCWLPDSSSDHLQIWVHGGQAGERQVMERQVASFQRNHPKTPLELTFIPEGSYNSQVQAGAISRDLPCLLELDGPFVYNYVWQENLISLDGLIPQKILQELLPSIINQGTYQGSLYSVGIFDSGLGLYGRRGKLESLGIRIPTSNQDAWTKEEFREILGKLALEDEDGRVLDLKLNYQGEWFTYAFSPLIQSAGGDLIERENYQTATGVLNGEEAITAMEEVQQWFETGYIDPNQDDAAFTSRRVSLAWGGHWNYPDYAEKLGEDLVILPLPDFGEGSKSAQGSWNWGISRQCSQPQLAAQFLEFLLQPEEVLAMVEANGAIPGLKGLIPDSPLYGEGKAGELFASQLLAGKTIPRPQTPAYPVITSTFGEAFANIRHGLEVKKALDWAVGQINTDLLDNQGYE